MQNWYSTLFHLIPLNRRYFSITERSLDFQKLQKSPYLHLSLPACSVSAAACRTPPYVVHRAPTAKWTRGVPQRHLAASWHLLTRTRVPDTSPSRHDTPAGAAPLPSPPARRRVAQGQIDRPQTPLPLPRNSLAYKNPRAPPSRPFSSFFLLPPLRHGRRDPARADRLTQPYIAPSDHRSSFATS